MTGKSMWHFDVQHFVSDIIGEGEHAAHFVENNTKKVFGVAGDVVDALPFASELAGAYGLGRVSSSLSRASSAGGGVLGKVFGPLGIAETGSEGFLKMEEITGINSEKVREREDNLHRDEEVTPADQKGTPLTWKQVFHMDQPPEDPSEKDLVKTDYKSELVGTPVTSDHARVLIDAGRADPGTKWPQQFKWIDAQNNLHTVHYDHETESEQIVKSKMNNENPPHRYMPGTDPGRGHYFPQPSQPHRNHRAEHIDQSSGAEFIQFPHHTSHNENTYNTNDRDSNARPIPVQPFSMGTRFAGVDTHDTPYGYLAWGAPQPTDHNPSHYEGVLNSAELY